MSGLGYVSTLERWRDPGLLLDADFTQGDVPGLPAGWFARASRQSFIRQDGSIGFAEPNEPALTWRGDAYALACEPISVNFLTHTMSMKLANAGFRQGFLADVPGAYGFESGIEFPLEQVNPLARAYYKNHLVPSGSVYALSVYVKMEDGSEPRVGGSSDPFVDFSLITKTSPVGSVYVKKQHIGGGLWRISTTATGTGVGPNHGIAQYPSFQTGRIFRLYGMQLEYMPFATSYIQTEAVAQIRAAPSVSIPLAGLWDVNVGGSLFMDAEWQAGDAGAVTWPGARIYYPAGALVQLLTPPTGPASYDRPQAEIAWVDAPPIGVSAPAPDKFAGRARWAAALTKTMRGVGVSGVANTGTPNPGPFPSPMSLDVDFLASVMHVRSLRLYNRDIDLARAVAL